MVALRRVFKNHLWSRPVRGADESCERCMLVRAKQNNGKYLYLRLDRSGWLTERPACVQDRP